MFGACVARPVLSGVHYDGPDIMLAASETESRRKGAAVASGMNSVYFARAEEGLVVMFASWTVKFDAEWAARMFLSPPWTAPGARKFGRSELCVIHYQAMRARTRRRPRERVPREHRRRRVDFRESRGMGHVRPRSCSARARVLT
jgi:hypothetical protein